MCLWRSLKVHKKRDFLLKKMPLSLFEIIIAQKNHFFPQKYVLSP